MQSNLNTTLTTSTAGAITTANNTPPPKTQGTGWFSSVVNWVTKPNQPIYLDRIKKIDVSWGDLLMDLASYGVEKKIKSIDNEQAIDNVSELIAEVLLAMGSIQGKKDHVLDSQNFSKYLITNLLDELYKHDLLKFDLGIEIQPKIIVEGVEDDDSEIIESEDENSRELDSVSSLNDKMIVLPKKQYVGGEIELRIELRKIFNNFLENMGLDQEHIGSKSDLIQWALYPNALVQFVKMFPGVPDVDKDKLEAIFIEYGVELCKIQKRLELKSGDEILSKNKGASEFADYLVEKQIKSLHEDGLSLEYEFLTHKKNKEFLTSNINQVLLQEVGVEEEAGGISWAWNVISDQIKMAIKAILAVVLTPTEENETAEARRNHLLDGILNQLSGKSKELLFENIEQINQMQKKDLCFYIGKYSKLEESPYQLDAEKLFARRNTVWLTEAQAFYNRVWHNNEVLTRDELLRELNTWEEYLKTDEFWIDSNSAEVKALLARQSQTWEDEAQNFLKVIIYDKIARNVLNKELSIKKFSEFFPSFFPANNVFQPLYKLIGEKSLALHEHMTSLEVKGEESRIYLLEANVKELTDFADSLLLTRFITTMEDKAAKGEDVIDLGYPFLNDMISHLIKKPKEGEDVCVGREFARTKVKSIVEDILMTVLADTIQKNCSAEREVVDVFPFLINKMIERALEGFDDITESCKTAMDDDFDLEFTAIAIKGLTEKLGIKAIKVKDTKEERVQQVKELLIKVLARDFIAVLLPQELFNSLLPPMFRKSKLWEMIGDTLIAPYISEIYEKVEAFQSTKDNSELVAAKQYRLDDGIRGKIFPIIEAFVEKLNKGVSTIKFGELLQSEDKEKSQIDFSVLDKFFGKALQKNGQISHLIASVVPSIIESIFAFHLNPKGEKTSRELATDLLWNLLNASSKCCEKIDAFTSAVLRGDDNAQFFVEESLTKEHLAILAAYRKEKKIESSTEMTAEEFKQCCIWAQTNQVLSDTVNHLMDHLVPEELWNDRVPEHFRTFLTREQVGSLLFDYLKDWNEFSTEMKALMHSGKEHVGKGDDLENASGFIEDKVMATLEDFCIPKDSDKPDERWLKEILDDLLKKENIAIGKPVTNLAIKYAYAILGKVLSCRIPGLSDSEILIKSLTESDILKESNFRSENSSPLVLKINELLPAVQKSYHKLNALENTAEAMSCRDFSQITYINLAFYLSAVQAAEKHEILLDFSNEFVIENDRIVFRVQIQDTETNERREVSIDVYNYIHWELAYRSIDSLIPKEGWKDLMPKFLRKVITKEFLATFAIPYVELAHKMQAPLQVKAEVGESFVDDVVAEERSKKRSLQALDLESNVLPRGSLHRDREPLERPILSFNRAEPRGPVNKHHKLEGLWLIDSRMHEKRLENIEKASTDLEAFIDVMVLDKISMFITDLANEDKSSSKKCEAQVLGAILSSPENALILLKSVKEDDFFDPTHKAIFEAIKEVFFEEKVLDVDLLIKKLKANVNFEHPDVDAYLQNLAQHEETSVQFKAHCDVLKKLTLKRHKPLIAGFPDFIDSLLREFLTTKVNVNLKQIRETLIKRAVYLIISEFLKPAEKDENGKVILSATKSSVVNIRQKLVSMINEYHPKTSGNQYVIAQKIVDEVLPEETWNTIFTEKDEEFVTREDLIKMVEESFVNEACKKIIVLQTKHNAAINVIKNLDEAAGLEEGKFGGLAKVVHTICTSIDSTIDEYSAKKGKIFDQPLLLNEVAKELFRDETTSGVIKESAHALVNICIAKLFLVEEGESPEKKLLEVLARMIEAYNAKDFNKTAESWLKEIIPEDLYKELLPDFLHDVITHEFLAEAIFKDYMCQITDVADEIRQFADIDDNNVNKLQVYVKDKLVALKDVDSRDGLSGFGGFIKNLEKVFLDVLDGDYNDDGQLVKIGPFLEKLLNANIAQIMAQPNVVGILDSRTFISEALAAALPMLGSVDDEEGYVELTDDQLEDLTPTALKKLGIALPRNKDEADADFRARVKKSYFEVKSGEMIAEIMFPVKAASLLVPKIAQESIWNNLVEALGNQVGRVTNKDSRILLAINLLGIDEEDKKAFKDLEEHLIDNKNLVGKEVVAEGLFKKGLKTLAMKKVDEIFDAWSPLLAPITWLARLFTKVVVSLALHFGVSQQAWNFVSSAESDEKLRRLIWKFLSFTKAYVPEVVDSDELSEDLGTKVSKVMEDENLLNGLQLFVGPRAADFFKDKQILAFLITE